MLGKISPKLKINIYKVDTCLFSEFWWHGNASILFTDKSRSCKEGKEDSLLNETEVIELLLKFKSTRLLSKNMDSGICSSLQELNLRTLH
jgi:hypothetical protein